MSYGGYRGYDDYYGGGGGGGGGGQRWDRERFERARAGGGRGPPVATESYRYDERDRYARGGERLDVEYDDRYQRSPRGGYSERERFHYEDDQYSTPSRRRPAFMEEDRFQYSGREVAPYNRGGERDFDYSYKSPSRPGPPLRRQSSLDTFNRRPQPRYDEEDLNVTVNVRPPPSQPPPRPYDPPRYDPPPRQYDYYREPQSRWDWYPSEDYREEDYRDVRIRRERERSTYRKRDSDYDDRDRYDDHDSPRNYGKRGRTKMPKRLVHRRALIDLGYPFEEDDDFFWVRVALVKDQIDDVIKISEGYFKETKSYSYNETKMIEAPPAESSHHSHDSHGDDQQQGEAKETVTETVTTKVIENPTPEDYAKYGQGGSFHDHNDDDDNHSHHSDYKSSHQTSHQSSHHSAHQSTTQHQGNGSDDSESDHKSRYTSKRSEHGGRSTHGGQRSASRHTSRKTTYKSSYEQENEVGDGSDSDNTEHGSAHESTTTRRTSKTVSSPTGKSQRGRSKSRGRDEKVYLQRVETPRQNEGNLQIVLPQRSKSTRRDRDIKSEIRELEAEKRALRNERDRSERNDIEIVRKGDYNTIEIDGSKRNKSRSRRASNKLAEAALYTLT